MNKYRYFLFLVLYLLLSSPIHSETIKGILLLQKDDMTQSPLANYQVFLVDELGKEKNNVSLTDETGLFSFSGVSSGSYSVNIYKVNSNWKILIIQHKVVLSELNNIIISRIPDIIPRVELTKDSINIWLSYKDASKQNIKNVKYLFVFKDSTQNRLKESNNNQNNFKVNIDIKDKDFEKLPYMVSITVLTDNNTNIAISFNIANEFYLNEPQYFKSMM